MKLENTPEVKLGIVAVSRDCFPAELSRKRLKALIKEAKDENIDLIAADTIIENESDALKASEELYKKGANAVVVYLGNFGPEGPTTIFIRRFHGPAMVCAAAEESGKDLVGGRGDAYCGMLNLSYNLKLRNLRAHIPERPVGLPDALVREIAHFKNVARVYIGVKNLKLISFGPRPQDFYACNAPIKPLYDIGVEVMENSELDLYQIFMDAEKNPDIKDIAADMKKELGDGCAYPDMLGKLAQYESALRSFIKGNIGSRTYAVMANKCWPAFERSFGFVPCYVNSRMAASGIPVACEVDLYGAVSEYMAQLASEHPVTILDINNTVPPDMTVNPGALEGFKNHELFMGFHCGNTATCCLNGKCALKYQLIMNRLMEGGKTPDITRGTLEGNLKPGDTTIFRIQSTAEGCFTSYVADGKILDIDPQSFGAIGVFGIKDLSRFYRHVLIEGAFPHHTAVAFKRSGAVLYDAVKLISGKTALTPLPDSIPYADENPFMYK